MRTVLFVLAALAAVSAAAQSPAPNPFRPPSQPGATPPPVSTPAPPAAPAVQLPPPIPAASAAPGVEELARLNGKRLGSVNGWVVYRGTDEYFFAPDKDKNKDKTASQPQ